MYNMMLENDHSPQGGTYYLEQKSDTAAALKRFLAGVRDHGTPFLVERVQPGNRWEFTRRNVSDICDERGIWPEFKRPNGG